MENMQNAENMAKVKEMMAKAKSEEVRLGGDLNVGVPIDYTSLSGKQYVGSVLFKKPTMRDYMKIGALKSEYMRQAGIVDLKLVDNSIKEMAQIMATLAVTIVKRPDWLMKLEDVEEVDLLFHVYDKYEEWENSFRKPVQSADNGDSTATERA